MTPQWWLTEPGNTESVDRPNERYKMKCILKEGYIRRITERIKDKKKKRLKINFFLLKVFRRK